MNIAVITGASSSLGKAFFKTLSARYPELDEIWLIDERREPLEQPANEHKSMKIRFVPLDLAQDSSYTELKNLLEGSKPTIRILINNAEYHETERFDEARSFDILSTINVNIKGMTMVNKVCLPYMKEGSCEIITGSVSSFTPIAGQAVYAASKAFARFFTVSLREELKREKIRVMLLSPGNTKTKMYKNSAGTDQTIDKADKLPFMDLDKVTETALARVAAGKGSYTPHAFFKGYEVLCKLMPSAVMTKLAGLESRRSA